MSPSHARRRQTATFNELPLKWILAVAISVGYVLGSLSVSLSWLLLFLIALYQIMKRMFGMSIIDDPIHVAMKDAPPHSGQSADFVQLTTSIARNARSRARPRTPKLSSGGASSSSRVDGGLSSCNAILETMWRNWHGKHEWLLWLNVTIAQYQHHWSTLFEKVEITDLDIGNDMPPVLRSIRLAESTDARTVVEADFEYNGAMRAEWRIVPKVLHLNVKSIVKDIVVAGTLRIAVEYAHDGTISEVNLSLKKYPHLDARVHVFDSVDIRSISNSIPSLSAAIKSRLRDYVQELVYPNTFPFKLWKATDESKRDTISALRFELSRVDTTNLEDELSRMLLGINDVLNTRLPESMDSDQRCRIKIGVCDSVLQVLKYGVQPNAVAGLKLATGQNVDNSRDSSRYDGASDSSRMSRGTINSCRDKTVETIKRGFQIINSLAFDGDANRGTACRAIIEFLLQRDNLAFIGSVVRSGPLADEFILNVLNIKDVKLRKMVSHAFQELNMEDVPLLAVNRSPVKK